MHLADKWHLDEVRLKIKGEYYVLWRAVDSNGLELDVFLQKHRNKRVAIWFLNRLLKPYPSPRVIVTDKLNNYKYLWNLCINLVIIRLITAQIIR